MEKKDNLKILVISQYFWPENFRLNDLVLYLKKKKHDIEILSGIPNYPNGKIFKEYRKNKNKFLKFNGCKVYRVNHLLRNKGSLIDLFLNFATFFISSLYYSIKNLRKKKYDFIIVFGTSPITTAIVGIILSKFTGSKLVLWVLDLWPEVLSDLGILKKSLFKNILQKIINFIYTNSHLVLCQSEAFVKKIKTSSKKIIFYTWPENIDLRKIKRNNSNDLNLVFAGNLGQAQNLLTVIKTAKMLKNFNVNWHFVGGGRFKENIIKYSKKHKLEKVNFYEHQKLNQIKYFFNKADILLLSLIKGDATSNTIPGKFQTYLLSRKPILCHADGIVAEYIKKYNLGLCSNPNSTHQLKKNILKFLNAKKLRKLDNYVDKKKISFLLKKFSKEKILNSFNKEIIENRPINEIKYISTKSINKLNQNNFILSALNLAFLGSLAEKRFHLNKNLICWPDGLMTKIIFNKNIKKIPGRDIIKKLKFHKDEKNIQIIGNLTNKNKDYLSKKFPRQKLIHVPLPYDTDENLKKLLKNRVKEGIIFLTLPTPKQENIAIHLTTFLKNYKIFCIGGAINMLSGEETPVPKILEDNLEFLWRLRFDTKRRLKRLTLNSAYLIYGIIFNKFNLILKKI